MRPIGLTPVLALLCGVSLTFSSPALPAADDDLQLRWIEPVGAESAASDEIDGVGVDDRGNVTITGVFRDHLTIGRDRLEARGSGDVFVIRYDRAGTVLWAKRFGGEGDDNAYDLALDGDGNILLSGWFAGTIWFGDTVLRSAGGQDMFLTKLGRDGSVRWARRFGGPLDDGGNEIDIAPDGTIAVGAISAGEFAAGGRCYRGSDGRHDSFVMRLGADGAVRQITPVTGPNSQRVRAIAFAGDGSILAGFEYRGRIALGRRSFASQGGWDGAAAKIAPSGRIAWAVPVASEALDNVRGIAPAPAGGAYIAGAIGDGGRIAGRAVEPVSAKADEYVARLDREGRIEWLIQGGTARRDVGAEIRGFEGGVLLSSVFQGRYRFTRDGGRPMSFDPPGRSAYLIHVGPDGGFRDRTVIEATGRRSGARGNTVDVSPNGRFVVQSIAYRGALRDMAGSETTAHHDAAVALYSKR